MHVGTQQLSSSDEELEYLTRHGVFIRTTPSSPFTESMDGMSSR